MTVTSVRKDPELLTMTITTELDARVERAWRLWSDPRQLERWWGPPTWPATVVDHDLTPGGRVTYFMTGPDGDKSHGWWQVLAVEPPYRLELKDGFADDDGAPNDAMPTTTTVVTLTERDGGRTLMAIETRFPSVEAMEQLVSMGMEEGMAAAMSQIDEILSTTRDVTAVVEATNLDTIYGSPLLDWSGVQALLDRGVTQAPGTGGPDRHTCWLATINHDGSPHVTGIGGLWARGAFWFETGEKSRKGRNLARDPRCALSVAIADFDLVVDGVALKITDPRTVAEMAARWAADGWPARVDDTGQAITADYSAPSAGAPPWHVYRLQPRTATAVGTVEPFGATRWHF